MNHDQRDWLRKSRSVPPAKPTVTPCRPITPLTRWAMRLWAWINNRKT